MSYRNTLDKQALPDAGHASGVGDLKSSLFYMAAVFLTIICGLGSRVFANQLPHFVSMHFGDALWAAMVYFGFRVLQVKRSLFFAALASLIFSFFIEFSQLYQADWINEIRRTLAGSLILGRGFLPVDLLRYVIGILCSFLLDHYLLIRRLPSLTLVKKA